MITYCIIDWGYVKRIVEDVACDELKVTIIHILLKNILRNIRMSNDVVLINDKSSELTKPLNNLIKELVSDDNGQVCPSSYRSALRLELENFQNKYKGCAILIDTPDGYVNSIEDFWKCFTMFMGEAKLRDYFIDGFVITDKKECKPLLNGAKFVSIDEYEQYEDERNRDNHIDNETKNKLYSFLASISLTASRFGEVTFLDRYLSIPFNLYSSDRKELWRHSLREILGPFLKNKYIKCIKLILESGPLYSKSCEIKWFCDFVKSVNRKEKEYLSIRFILQKKGAHDRFLYIDDSYPPILIPAGSDLFDNHRSKKMLKAFSMGLWDDKDGFKDAAKKEYWKFSEFCGDNVKFSCDINTWKDSFNPDPKGMQCSLCLEYGRG